MKELPEPPYKFNELDILYEIEQYIQSTYSQHYSGKEGDKIQVVEFVMSHQDTFDYLTGNVIKYASRYGKKKGHNKDDLMKAVHYTILALHYHNQRFGD